MEWPKTNSNSSATTESMKVPSYGSSADRITEPPISSTSKPMGDDPIDVSEEVKYKEYENDKRMTEDFDAGPDNSDKTAGFDGVKTIEPAGEPAASFIDTSHSER